MVEKDCNVCKKMVKEKYKRYGLFKTLVLILAVYSAIISTLYFANGDVLMQETNTYNNDVEIINDGGGSNTNNPSINNNSNNQTQTSNMPMYIIISVIIGAGILGGCLIYANKIRKES